MERNESSFPASDENDAMEAWCEAYLASDLSSEDMYLFYEFRDDVLDEEEYEDQVKSLATYQVVTEGVCTSCRCGLADWPAKGSDRHPTHLWRIDTLGLAAAARAGCKLCAFFLSRLDSREAGEFRKIEARFRRLGREATSQLRLEAEDGREIFLGYPGKTLDDVQTSASVSLCQTVVAHNYDYTRWEKAGLLETVSMWMEQCDAGHNECRQHETEFEWPRRLVSVGGNAVKVVETQAFTTLPRYATLSYCWGQADFTMLTTETLTSFQKGIRWSELPRTMRDAIAIARRLGLGYIWIDSLCIIQQEEGHLDWLCESGKMRSIYGGSHVNIAASSATDAHQGCLVESGGYIGGLSVPVPLGNGSGRRLFSDPLLLQRASTSNLSLRAWAFQERLLAPRTVHFGEHGALWECRVGVVSSHLPGGFDDRTERKRLVRADDEEWDWKEIVGSYAHTQLTVGSDRLPALAGVARRHAKLTGRHYLAGMWRETLVDQLVWVVLTHPLGYIGYHKRPEWRAPTWSWASVEGVVDPELFVPGDADEQDQFISVLDAWTTPSGLDIFGAVSGGELTLACSALVQGFIVVPTEADISDPADAESSPYVSLCGAAEVTLENTQQAVPIRLDCEHRIHTEDDVSVYLLPVGHGTSVRPIEQEDGYRGYPPMLAGLVLQRLKSGARGRFVRMGSFFFYESSRGPGSIGGSGDSDPLDEILGVLDEVGARTAGSVCTRIEPCPEDRNERYVIVIE